MISRSGSVSCYGIDISHGPKRSKKGNKYSVERYRALRSTTHVRKALIAGNASDESSSEKDASWTMNGTEMARTSES